jgi:hypothetical protein
VPSAVAVQLPLLAAAVLTGRVAAGRDRSAVVVVWTGPAQTVASVIALAEWPASGVGTAYVSAGLLLADVGTPAQAYTRGTVDLLACLAFLVPAGVNAGRSLGTWRAINAGQAAHHAPGLRGPGTPPGRSARGRPDPRTTATAPPWPTSSCPRSRPTCGGSPSSAHPVPPRSWRPAASTSRARTPCAGSAPPPHDRPPGSLPPRRERARSPRGAGRRGQRSTRPSRREGTVMVIPADACAPIVVLALEASTRVIATAVGAVRVDDDQVTTCTRIGLGAHVDAEHAGRRGTGAVMVLARLGVEHREILARRCGGVAITGRDPAGAGIPVTAWVIEGPLDGRIAAGGAQGERPR